MVESGNCCWKTDLGVVLTPLIKTGHVFGSNWLMYSKFSAFHWLLKIYGVAHYLLSVFLLIVLCLHINSSDGIQAKTLIKLMFFVHVLVGMTSHTFNIRVQNQMSDLLEKFAILKNKKLGLNNVKLRIFGYVISFVTIFLTVCSTAGFYAILVGPLKSVFKLNTFGRYEFDVLVTILFYLPTSALSIAFQYNLILSFTSFCLCETYHTGIKSFSDSIAAINDWDKEYHLFLNLVDFLNDLMGWHIFLYNGIFFIHLILNLVLFASTASQFPPDTIFVYLCWSTGSALAVMLNFITVIKVNEAVNENCFNFCQQFRIFLLCDDHSLSGWSNHPAFSLELGISR